MKHLFTTYFFIIAALLFVLKPATASDGIKFGQNNGQWHPNVVYRLSLTGTEVYFEKNKITYQIFDQNTQAHGHEMEDKIIKGHTYSVSFLGANVLSTIKGQNKLSYYENYFIGNIPEKWATGVSYFTEIKYENIYKGISARYYSSGQNLKYDIVVAPGANTNQIALKYEGEDQISLLNGKLQVLTSIGTVVENAPIVYQNIADGRTIVPCEYVLKNNNTLSFKFPKGYNKNYPLVIDPELVFCSYTGSTADNFGFTATFDTLGNAYAGGDIRGNGYPTTTGAFQTTFNGPGVQLSGTDMAISKFSSDGKNLLYSTYLGGSGFEQPQSMIVNSQNQLCIYGRTSSTDFPTSTLAYQKINGGKYDITVSILAEDGKTLIGSTYIGGLEKDGVNINDTISRRNSLKYNFGDDGRGEIQLDAEDNIYIASNTSSANFPTTLLTAQGSLGGMQDGVVFKMNPNVSLLTWSTFLGGATDDAAYGIALDANNNIFVSGGTQSTGLYPRAGAQPTFGGITDGYLAKISNNGQLILGFTYVGTNKYDQTYFVQTDLNNDVYTFGQTKGNMPVSNNVFSTPNGKMFIKKYNNALTTNTLTTVFGNGDTIPPLSPTAFLVDVCGNIYISGWGGNVNRRNLIDKDHTAGLPTTSNALRAVSDSSDFYFLVLSQNARFLAYATYFGEIKGIQGDHVDGGTSRFDKKGIIYQSVCASCGGTDNFPVTPGAYSTINGSTNCNNAIIKFSFDGLLQASFQVDTNVCFPDSVRVKNTSSLGFDYLWDFGDGTTSTLYNPPAHYYTTAGDYKIKLLVNTLQSCYTPDSQTTTIHISAKPLLNTNLNDRKICAGESTTLDASVGMPYAYEWNNATTLSNNKIANPVAKPKITTTYIVKITNGNCTLMDSVKVTVFGIFPEATIDAQPRKSNNCFPFTVNFENTSTTGQNYFWDFADGGTSTDYSPSHTFTSAGTFKVRLIVEAKDSCKARDTATLDIVIGNGIPHNAQSTFNICLGDALAFDATQNGNYTYKWTPADGLDNPDSAKTKALPQATTTYICTVSDGLGCQSQDTVVVNVRQPITSDFEIIKDECKANYSFNPLNLEAFGTLEWDFGDGSPVDTTRNPSHNFTSTGNFDITLTASNGPCKDKILVKNSFFEVLLTTDTIIVPNVFTPNGDNKNESFAPIVPNKCDLQSLTIFDRWGIKVYESKNYKAMSWDGTALGGTSCPDGVYFFLLKGKNININSNVTIAR